MAGAGGRPASCLEATPQAREYMCFWLLGRSVREHIPGALGESLEALLGEGSAISYVA